MGMGYASPANELRRQATTAASSATGQHLPAIFGCHTRTKSMIALPFENAGLKCTLHGGYLLFRKSVTTHWDRVRYQCGVRLDGCRLQRLNRSGHALRGADYRRRTALWQGRYGPVSCPAKSPLKFSSTAQDSAMWVTR